ncbi:MAG: T9SS type A sorting domain-containing protein [Bacteroidota bacterium]
MINIYDLQGKQIRSMHLDQTEMGEIVVPASEFNPGIYIYNLIVDGFEIDSKRMVLTE